MRKLSCLFVLSLILALATCSDDFNKANSEYMKSHTDLERLAQRMQTVFESFNEKVKGTECADDTWAYYQVEYEKSQLEWMAGKSTEDIMFEFLGSIFPTMIAMHQQCLQQTKPTENFLDWYSFN